MWYVGVALVKYNQVQNLILEAIAMKGQEVSMTNAITQSILQINRSDWKLSQTYQSMLIA